MTYPLHRSAQCATLNPMSTRLLTYTEAAQALGVSRRTLYYMIERGTLVPVYVSRPSGKGTVPRLHAGHVARFVQDRDDEQVSA